MGVLFVVARVLVIIGALNWGLVGAFDFNLVDAIFGDASAASRVIYVIVGIAALLVLVELFVPRKSVRDKSH